MFIQPVDCLLDGRQNMCDSCPDLTVFKDRLVYSCRLEEMKRYEDEPAAKVGETFHRMMYPSQSLGMRIIGEVESMKAADANLRAS
jgi:hypothetical protein